LRREALSEERRNFQSRLEADAIDRDFVYLTGEVTTRGRFPLPFGRHASLADALFAQGGPLPATGNPAEIYLLRGDKHDRVTAFHLDGRNPINMLKRHGTACAIANYCRCYSRRKLDPWAMTKIV